MSMIGRSLRLMTRQRDFALLMATQFFAQAGDGVVQGALGKLISFGGQEGFDLEGARSPEELLRIALYVMVPYTILSPFVGVVIDRWDRRRLLFLANAVRAAAVVVVAFGLAFAGEIAELPLFAAFLLTLVSTRIVLATKAAAIPATVEPGSLMHANSVSQLGGALFQLGGFGVALISSALLPVWPIALVGAIVYGIGAIFPLLIQKTGEPRPTSTLAAEVRRVVERIVAGVAEVARTAKAAASITTYFWLRLLWSYTLVGISFIARDLLAGDDLTIAALTGGAGAAGAVLGFVSADRLTRRVRSTAHLVVGSSFVAGAAVTILGGLELQSAIALLAFFLGFGFFLAKISLDTMVQEALGDDFRGRAFSLYDISYNLAWVVAAAAMYALWTDASGGSLIAGMGVVFLLGVAGLTAWFGRAGLLRPQTETRTEAGV